MKKSAFHRQLCSLEAIGHRNKKNSNIRKLFFSLERRGNSIQYSFIDFIRSDRFLKIKRSNDICCSSDEKGTDSFYFAKNFSFSTSFNYSLSTHLFTFCLESWQSLWFGSWHSCQRDKMIQKKRKRICCLCYTRNIEIFFSREDLKVF